MIAQQYTLRADQTTSEPSKTHKIAQYIMYTAYTWLLLQPFIPKFPYKWVVFITLVIVSNLLISKYMNILYLIGFYSAYYMLSLVLPAWFMSLIFIGLIIYLMMKYKKRIDDGDMDFAMDKAQMIAAQMQLKACKLAIKKGHYVDPEFIKELEEAAKGDVGEKKVN